MKAPCSPSIYMYVYIYRPSYLYLVRISSCLSLSASSTLEGGGGLGVAPIPPLLLRSANLLVGVATVLEFIHGWMHGLAWFICDFVCSTYFFLLCSARLSALHLHACVKYMHIKS
jgi:hypothetical protein